MTAFSVYRPGAQRVERRPQHPLGPHPKMVMRTEGGRTFVVPWAPRDTAGAGLAPNFEQIARDGRKPLLLFSGYPLEEHTFDIAFGNLNGDPIDHDIQRLQDVVNTRARLRVVFDGRTFDSRLWRITSLAVQIIQRQHGTNRPTQATAGITLTEASDVVVHVGPVTGGARPSPSTPAKRKPVAAPPRRYVVRRGDTLSGIALRFYGDASRFPRIARANKIRNVNRIFPGQRLVIP